VRIGNSRLAAISVVALLFLSATYLFGWSQIFVVKEVSITGAPTAESTQAVTNSIAIAPGVKMARVETRSIARRLDSFTWIESVDISRNWLNQKVSIEITPRKPIALFNPATAPGTSIDAQGKVFTLPGGARNSLPKVEANSSKSGIAAIALFTELPEEFRSDISLMSVRRSGAFSLSYRYKLRPIGISWGDGEDTALKVQVVQALLALPENSKIKSIDVSAPHAPIVR
jgi:cell division septal protein FtsQ